ncbi:hypothetical protein ES708_02570 [subsurface metagenome]
MGGFTPALQTALGFFPGYILGVTKLNFLKVITSLQGRELGHFAPGLMFDLNKFLSARQLTQLTLSDVKELLLCCYVLTY